MTSGLWYRAALRDDLIAARQVSMIREQFADALGAAGWPDGACLFLITRHARTGRVRDDHNPGLRDAPCRYAARLGSLAAPDPLRSVAHAYRTTAIVTHSMAISMTAKAIRMRR